MAARVAAMMPGRTTVQIVNHLHRGLSISALESLRAEMGLGLEQLLPLAGISGRTLARRRRQNRLSPEESERIFRLHRLFQQAVMLFEGDRRGAMRWLNTPRAVFGGKCALDFARSELGAREVEDVIERIEYGVIS